LEPEDVVTAIKRFPFIAIFALVAALLVVTGCSGADGATEGDDKIEASAVKNEKGDKKGKGDKEDEAKEEAVPIEVAALETGPIASTLAFSANLEAERQVKVVAEASRQVTKLLVEEGDYVKRGQLLVRLQDDAQRSALTKVKSQVEKAEREYVRQERLFKQDLISEETYNNATYELEQLRISQEDTERELSYTQVKAPISGTVTARMVSLGDQVQISQELFEIIDFDSIVARVYVPEKHLSSLFTGLPANVKAQSALGLEYACKVKRIAPIVDPKSGTVKVTINVGAKQGFRPGMYVDVDLITATHAEALLVPKRAIIYDNDQMFVYRLKGTDRVERVFLDPLLADKFHIEPTNGFDVGDQVVIAGQAGLKEGALVRLPGNDSDANLSEPESDEVKIVDRASL
jgi:membrane fusion protein (multidrug efflux system)